MAKGVMEFFQEEVKFPGQELFVLIPGLLLNIPKVYFPSFIPGFNPPWDGWKSFQEALEG